MRSLAKHFFLCATLCVTMSCTTTKLEPVAIHPTPQQVSWSEGSLDASEGFNLVGAQSADSDAVRELSEGLKISEQGVKLIVGESGDAQVSEYQKFIPTQREGYYLSVKGDEVVIAGHDGSGTFYGVQTFLQILAKSGGEAILQTEITDYPTVVERGMIEGYYGNPLSYEDRVSQFEFYAQNKMNVYIYGPKDDPYHGFSDRWREFYPEEQAKKLQALVGEAAKNKVQFVWAVHPGNNIHWNQADKDATIKKFESVYKLGVRAFAVFFDDISGEGTDPKRQVEYLNYLQKEFVDKKNDVAPLIFCPTQYNQAWSSGDYLDILGDELLPEIRVMWTGKSVCRMIDDETMEWINSRLNRNAYIWLNYPVTDYVIDHLLMGPFVGNSPAIAQQLSGFVSNPMEYGEASKVALFSIADYAWNMEKFDAQQSWLAALRAIMPNNYEAFKVFCENNVDIGISYHGLRMPNESAEFAVEAAAFMDGFVIDSYSEEKTNAIKARMQSFRSAAAELKASTHNANLVKEITPWLDVFDLVAQRGEVLLDMQKALSLKDSAAFVAGYVKIKELEAQQKAVRSRDFEGSIKSTNPKAANEVVAPFFAELQSDMLKFYRDNYTYRIEEFPVDAIAEGRYYIKVDGKFLTNPRGATTPTLIAAEDDINPQRQEWVVTKDNMIGRYKIVSAQDDKFLSEGFALRDSRYNPAWHTFVVHKGENGRYALQNGGFSGERYVIFRGNTAERVGQSSFVFEFVPIAK